MKIVLTGGGTGGHFYPVIAVAQEINNIVKENRLLKPSMYFMSTSPYNEGLLFENDLKFVKVTSGKIRRSKSLQNFILNFFDLWRIVFGCVSATWKLFVIYPDVVFGKGGYTSFPALFAARLLRIPVIIHESDSKPGMVNKWAGKFAKKIAISYPEAGNYFPKDKTAYTGNPVRREIKDVLNTNGKELMNLDPNIPAILILGGSQGARFINNAIIDALPELVSKYQVIHQTGPNNLSVMKETANVVLLNSEHKERYRPYDYLKILDLRAAAGAADIIVSRAGSSIFEIAIWGKPSIIIPIPEETSHDQRSNAYSYARSGSAVVIEERNLTKNVLLAEIFRILNTPELKNKMIESTKNFARVDSARLIADEVVSISIEHDR